MYRDLSGLVATGTAPRPITANDEALTDVLVIPYYALNMVPTGGMTQHALLAVAFAYIDNVLVMQSVPMPFGLRW
jgi:hypothetical protein